MLASAMYTGGSFDSGSNVLINDLLKGALIDFGFRADAPPLNFAKRSTLGGVGPPNELVAPELASPTSRALTLPFLYKLIKEEASPDRG